LVYLIINLVSIIYYEEKRTAWRAPCDWLCEVIHRWSPSVVGGRFAKKVCDQFEFDWKEWVQVLLGHFLSSIKCH